jgi:hypothetical protein
MQFATGLEWKSEMKLDRRSQAGELCGLFGELGKSHHSHWYFYQYYSLASQSKLWSLAPGFFAQKSLSE